jgi:hypothetical protein
MNSKLCKKLRKAALSAVMPNADENLHLDYFNDKLTPKPAFYKKGCFKSNYKILKNIQRGKSWS